MGQHQSDAKLPALEESEALDSEALGSKRLDSGALAREPESSEALSSEATAESPVICPPDRRKQFKQPVGFLSLPGELRNQIYQHIAEDYRQLLLKFEASTRNEFDHIRLQVKNFCPHDPNRATLVPAIYSVSPQIRQEVKVFLSETRRAIPVDRITPMNTWTWSPDPNPFGHIASLNLALETTAYIHVCNAWLPSGNFRPTIIKLRAQYHQQVKPHHHLESIVAWFWYDLGNHDFKFLSLTDPDMDRISNKAMGAIPNDKPFTAGEFLHLIMWSAATGHDFKPTNWDREINSVHNLAKKRNAFWVAETSQARSFVASSCTLEVPADDRSWRWEEAPNTTVLWKDERKR